MKKKSMLLALVMAGAMTLGAVAATGCKKKPSDNGDNTHTQHVFDGEWQVTEANKPTLLTEGKAVRYCAANDGGEESKVLPALTDERYSVTDNTATATASGTGKYTITLDGAVISFTAETPALGGGENPDDEEEKPVILTSDTAIAVTAGETKKLSAPAAGTVWKSGDVTVATVDSNGLLSAKTAGVTKVMATAEGLAVTCTVVVLKKTVTESEIPEKDPFKFNKTVNIGSVDVPEDNEPSDENAEEYTVKFTDGAVTQYVENGGLVVEPVGIEKAGYYITGWNDGAKAYDFSKPTTKNMTLTAQWSELPAGVEAVYGNQESITVIWNESNPQGAKVEYSLKGENNWKAIDGMLIRKDGQNARADLIGLAAGVYTVKITTSAGAEKTVSDVKVTAYDRSGYAHFKYDKGVGAYKDDGTIKRGTLVIYLTDENKNDVLDYCYVDGKKVDITRHVTDAAGVVHRGIGEIFNNRRYSGDDRKNVGIAKLSHVYGAVSLRVLGEVTNEVSDKNPYCSITGLTNYNSLENGGTVGDSGGMARIVNAKNVTIEGVGDNAVINGWGFHFVSSPVSRVSEEDGTSFEARNLSFKGYPEDALGMEGEQSNVGLDASIELSDKSSPVERCWVHNNSFYQGGNGSAAEGDKNEGDGSCDFKRGRNYTFSYNYLTDCHKTNLIGSSKTSLQYNVSMHHNWWNDCQSRIPLMRNANVHFYNNYVSVRGEDAKTSVVHSVRAQSYLFSEANYYDGCKTVAENGGEGGNIGIKGYNDMYHACYNGDATTKVEDREQKVANGCQYQAGKIDYSSFDTNPDLFYYDAQNKKSDCLLDDPVGARMRTVRYSGVLGHGAINLPKVHMNKITPASSVNVKAEGTVIDVASATPNGVDNGVVFGETFKSGKGKGQLITFTLSAPAIMTITATGKGDEFYPQVIRANGKVFVPKFSGQKTVLLPAGTYMVTTGQKDKEATVTELKFEDTAASGEIRVKAAIEALSAIPEVITRNSKSVIETAGFEYNNLIGDEKNQIPAELYQRYLKAVKAYEDISVEYVTARIDYIGTVTELSADDINAALKAYQELSAETKLKITNRDKLSAAQTAFEAFAVKNVNNLIAALPAQSQFGLIIDSKPAIELVTKLYTNIKDEYRKLSDEQKGQVSLTAVDSALEALEAAMKPFDFKDLINSLPESAEDPAYMTVASQLKALYSQLTADQKALITDEETAIYEEALALYEDYASKAVVMIFAKGNPLPEGVEVNGNYKDGVSFDFNEQTYNSPLKMESSTSVKFTANAEMKLTLQVSAGGVKIKIDGKEYTVDGNGVLNITVTAGQHTVTKGGSCNLYWLTLNP